MKAANPVAARYAKRDAGVFEKLCCASHGDAATVWVKVSIKDTITSKGKTNNQ